MFFVTRKKYEALQAKYDKLEKQLKAKHDVPPPVAKKAKRVKRVHSDITIREALLDAMPVRGPISAKDIRKAVNRKLGRRVPKSSISPCLYNMVKEGRMHHVARGIYKLNGVAA